MDDASGDIELANEKKNSTDVNDDGKYGEMPKSCKRKIMKIPLKNKKTNDYRDRSHYKHERWYH